MRWHSQNPLITINYLDMCRDLHYQYNIYNSHFIDIYYLYADFRLTAAWINWNTSLFINFQLRHVKKLLNSLLQNVWKKIWIFFGKIDYNKINYDQVFDRRRKYTLLEIIWNLQKCISRLPIWGKSIA